MVPTTCLCACHSILYCVHVLKRRNAIRLSSICAWLARLLGTTLNEVGLKEKNIYAQNACVCVKLCVLILSVCGCIVLTCCRVLTCEWRQQVVWVGAAAPQVFFNLKYLFCGSWRRNPQKDLRKLHKSPFVVVLHITQFSLDVYINVVHTTASDKGQNSLASWTIPSKCRRRGGEGSV